MVFQLETRCGQAEVTDDEGICTGAVVFFDGVVTCDCARIVQSPKQHVVRIPRPLAHIASPPASLDTRVDGILHRPTYRSQTHGSSFINRLIGLVHAINNF